jgi:heat shock protein HtpX
VLKRVFLFLLTNLLVIALLSIVLRLIGFSGYYDAQGINLDYNSLAVFAAVFGFGGSFISLFISKWIAKRATGARVITNPANPTEAWLMEATHRLADKAGVGRPEVAIFDGPPNAFATGWNRNNALVAVSTGLIQQMNQDQAEAVIGHEIAHVANGDMVTMTLIQGVVNTFVIFFARIAGHFVDRVILKNERGRSIGGFFATIAFEIVFGILASVVVMWFSRLREYRADEGGAALTSRDSMISALRVLGGQRPNELPEQMAAFGINGGGHGGLRALLRSHPSIDKRIAALGG